MEDGFKHTDTPPNSLRTQRTDATEERGFVHSRDTKHNGKKKKEAAISTNTKENLQLFDDGHQCIKHTMSAVISL